MLLCITEIYRSIFTNVRFWKKTEFLNVIFREKRWQNYRNLNLNVLTQNTETQSRALTFQAKCQSDIFIQDVAW